MATRWLHFRVEEQLLERARQAAQADRRSLSNWVALTIERALAAEQNDTQATTSTPLAAGSIGT